MSQPAEIGLRTVARVGFWRVGSGTTVAAEEEHDRVRNSGREVSRIVAGKGMEVCQEGEKGKPDGEEH
jgi:hypothetical protein